MHRAPVHGMRWASFSLAFALGLSTANAQASCESSVAVIEGAIGQVELRQNGYWTEAKRGDHVCSGGAVRTGENSGATISVEIDGEVLELDELTQVIFGHRRGGYLNQILFELGRAFFLSGDDVRTDIITPHVNGGIEGTEFLIAANIDGKRSLISVYDGKVRAKSKTGAEEVLLTSGETVIAGEDQPFRVLDPNRPNDVSIWRPLVRPIDAVSWVLYYHPVLQSDAGAELIRAQSLLTTGQVDEATSVLDALPPSADKMALKTIIAVVQAQQADERLSAIDLGRQALARDPTSPAANIALSYALQGNGDLKDARSLMRSHVEQNAASAIAVIRLAELELSLGRIGEAERLAERALAEDNRISRAHAVLGFIALARTRLSSAYDHFEKAIDLDNGDPAPRLGKGLTFIRDGKIKEGRKHLQISVALDPNQSLTRSYLGRAYFEEGEWDEAIEEYERAKQLDPQDPTPWFYQGIWELANHRPLPAYRALKKSDELNDNRQVHRSKESLAQDRAARGAITGGVFQELRLEEFGLDEAMQAIHSDPSNFAAHRQLANMLGEEQRFESARASANLKSKLLQPLTKDIIQPRLEESELTFMGGAGFGQIGVGEYSSLFETDGTRVSFTGGIASNQTYTDELLLSGILGPVSYAFSQFRYKTDGYRTNNDIRHDILTAFVQWELSEKLSIQGEFRYRESEFGDIILNFDPEEFDQRERRRRLIRHYRVGAKFTPTPQHTLLVNFADIDQRTDGIRAVALAEGSFHSVRPVKSIQANHIWRPSKDYSLELGLHQSTINGFSDSETDVTALFMGACPPVAADCIFRTFQEEEANRFTAYLYNRFELFDVLKITAGVSFNNLNQGPRSQDLTLPNVGLHWEPTKELSLSAAYQSRLSRTFSVDQSLEPVGFASSILTDTPGLTHIEGVTAQVSYSKQNLFIQAGFEQRTESIAFIETNNSSVSFGEHDEMVFAGSVDYFATDDFKIGVSPSFRRSEFDGTIVSRVGGPNTPSEIETTKVPLSIAYLGSDDVSGSVTGSYVFQSPTFNKPGNTITDQSESFFLLDAKVNYRVPNSNTEFVLSANNILNQGFRYQQHGILLPVADTLPFIPERTFSFHSTFRF